MGGEQKGFPLFCEMKEITFTVGLDLARVRTEECKGSVVTMINHSI